MDYLGFWLLAIGAIGYVAAKRKQIRNVGHDVAGASSAGFPSYGVLAVMLLVAGIVLSFIKFGWWGFAPLVAIGITMRLAVGK